MVALTVVISFIAIIYGIKSFNRKKYDKAILILIFFLTNGFQIIPGSTQGISYFNIGILYMLMLIYLVRQKRLFHFNNTIIEKLYTIFLISLLLSAIFSVLYYNFLPSEVLRIFRLLIPFACVYLYNILSPTEFKKIFNLLLNITLFLNILFIIQCFTGTAILHSYFSTQNVNEFGIARFYNKPIFSTFFFYYIILNSKHYTKSFLYTSIGILFTALLLTQNRLEIITVISVIAIIILFSNISATKKIILTCFIIIAFIPIHFIMNMRDTSSTATTSTNEDVENILNGHFKADDYLYSENNGTLTFRFAMVTERIVYLAKRNLAENIWGLGMGNSDYKAVNDRYNFLIGTPTLDKTISQLYSADCAWVEIICQWGYGGMVLFLIMYLSLTIYFYKNRKQVLSMTAFGYLIMLFLCSLTGNWIANPVYHLLPLMTYFYLNKTIPKTSIKTKQ